MNTYVCEDPSSTCVNVRMGNTTVSQRRYSIPYKPTRIIPVLILRGSGELVLSRVLEAFVGPMLDLALVTIFTVKGVTSRGQVRGWIEFFGSSSLASPNTL